METTLTLKEHYEWLNKMVNSKPEDEFTYLNVSNYSKELQDYYRSKVNDRNEYIHAFGVVLIDFESMSLFNYKSN